MARVIAIDLIGRDVTLSKTLTGAGKRFTDLRKTVEHANRRQREALDTLATGATVTGGALVAGFGAAVKATIDFDKAMSNVGAVSDASASDLEKLRQAALKAGKDTIYSATEAAKAEAELAKTGISTADILGGALTGSLSLAAAGQLELEEAATLSGQAMKIFNLQGKDVGRVADVLAAGANKSAADVHQLGEALRAGGLVASQAGANLEDTIGVLSAFADNALIGSDAGTSLKTMLIHLMAPSDKSAGLMEELGIKVYDTTGKFVSFANLAKQLRDRLGHLSAAQRDAALAQIFGTDAIRGANILYKLGADGVIEYTNAVNDQGAASRVAAKNLDNLAGDLEQLKGSIETALISGGSVATGTLRDLVQAAANAVDVFNAMPPAVQGGVVAVGGLSGAALLAAGGFVYLIPKIAETRAAMATLGITADTLKVKLATLGKAALWITAIAVSLDQMNKLQDVMKGASATVDDLTKDLAELARTGKMTGAVADQWTGVWVGAEDAPKAFGDAIREIADPTLWEQALRHPVSSLADALPFVDGAFQKMEEKIRNVDQALAQMATSGNADQAKAAFEQIAKHAKDAGVPMDRLKTVFPEYTKAAASSVARTASAAKAQAELAEQADAAAKAMEEAREEVEWFNKAAADAEEAQSAFEASLDEATQKLKENGRVLDLNKAKGRDNRAVLRGMARDAAEVAKKVFEETGSVDKANAAFERNVKRMKDVLKHAGFTKKEIANIVAAYLQVPKKMQGMAGDVEKALNKIKKKREVHIGVYANGELIGYKVPGGTLLKAKGGEIPMVPGGSRNKDSVPALLRVGEHVWTPEEVNKVGGHQQMLKLRKLVMGGQLQMQRLATGGPVGYPQPAASAHGITGLGKFASQVNSRYNSVANRVGGVLSDWLNKFWLGPGKKAVNAARSQIGVPYSWGGGGPSGPSYGFAQGAHIRGFDCSSLMQYGWYKATGKVIPRTTYSQYPWTRYVSKPKPGDLGFMNFSSSRGLPEHVVMYAGNRRIIEAPFTGARVREAGMRSAHWGRPPIARARGGSVRPGEVYMVGERGPETLQVGAPGRITPNEPLRVVFDTRGADTELLRLLRRMVRIEGGGDVQKALGGRRS